MDLVFLGGVFEKDRIEEIMQKSKSAIQFAADALQWNIIEGLDYWNGKPIKIINALFIGSYPKLYKDVYVKKSKWSHTLDSDDYNISFINLWGIKNIFRAINAAWEVKKWSLNKGKEKAIIAYSVNLPFLWALRKAKKTNSSIITCIVVPDLPGYMNLSAKTSLALILAKKLDIYLINKLMKYVDAFVLLTENMSIPLKVGDRRYCIVEGMVNKKDIIRNNQYKSNIRTKNSILYTGTLNYKYGIGILLKAFELIDDNTYELWICGYGEAETRIKEMAETDSRIKWFGAVSREEALSLQQISTVVINPRPPGEEFTKYSFPSKNLEYLLSGRPVIAYKLPGITDDYDEYMFFINGEGPTKMAETIKYVCGLKANEQNEIGERAREFVLRQKNSLVQTKKIIEMIKGLMVSNEGL